MRHVFSRIRWVLIVALASHAPLRADTNPPAVPAGATHRATAPTAGSVKAIVVRSWRFQGAIWQYLSDNWSQYGTTPIQIDDQTLLGVGSFTLQQLEASGASVVIVSDPAGGLMQWTAQEVQDLEQYARQGHDLIGTYLLFQYDQVDNRALAPLWGLRPDLAYDTGSPPPAAAATTPLLVPSHCLFARLTDPLPQGGWPFVEAPVDGSWDPDDLAEATMLARSADGHNIVTEYLGPGYRASYISYMPEYESQAHAPSVQFLYNAIVCAAGPTGATSGTWGQLKSLYR